MFTSILVITLTSMQVIIIFSAMLKIMFLSGSFAEDTFDVLTISNVPFPHSPHMAADIRNPPHYKEIPEFTVCFRFLFTFYNDGWIPLIHAKQKKIQNPWDEKYFAERLAYNLGFDYQGYQHLSGYLERNIPGGDAGGKKQPVSVVGNLQRNVATGKWQHACNTYSSIQHKRHSFYNGLKVYSFNYSDLVEGPMPPDTFHYIVIGGNMRGLFTDLQIYDRMFNEEEMKAWTSSCDRNEGEIFRWSAYRFYTVIR